jgi:hypothetical protein
MRDHWLALTVGMGKDKVKSIRTWEAKSSLKTLVSTTPSGIEIFKWEEKL